MRLNMRLTAAEHAALEAAATAAGVSVTDYVRGKLGMPEALRGRPVGSKKRKPVPVGADASVVDLAIERALMMAQDRKA